MRDSCCRFGGTASQPWQQDCVLRVCEGRAERRRERREEERGGGGREEEGGGGGRERDEEETKGGEERDKKEGELNFDKKQQMSLVWRDAGSPLWGDITTVGGGRRRRGTCTA